MLQLYKQCVLGAYTAIQKFKKNIKKHRNNMTQITSPHTWQRSLSLFSSSYSSCHDRVVTFQEISGTCGSAYSRRHPSSCHHPTFRMSTALFIHPMLRSVRLRSSTSNLLDVRPSRCVTVGDRSFATAGPRLWNSLPADVRSASWLTTFRRKLKTHLFRQSYPDIVL